MAARNAAQRKLLNVETHVLRFFVQLTTCLWTFQLHLDLTTVLISGSINLMAPRRHPTAFRA